MQNRAAPQAAKRRKIRPFWRIFRRFLRFVRLFPVLLRQLAVAPGSRTPSISASVSGRMTLAGLPKSMEPAGASIFPVTSAPAPTMQLLPIFAPLKTVAPIPMSTLSPTVQPWTMAPWPMVQPAPTWVSSCSTAQS